MRLSKNRAIFLRTLAAAVILTGLAAGGASASEQQWTRTYGVTGHPQVAVNTNDGAVRIITGDTKQVVFRVYFSGYTLDKDLSIESQQNGNSLEITAKIRSGFHWGWGGISRSLRIEVYIPKDADLQVDTGDGSVETQYLAGNLGVHTGDGSIRVEGAKGSIQLRTGDGSIEAQALDGRVEASSGDGHVSLAGRFDSVDVKTGDGSVNVRATSGSQLASGWNIRTGDGSVDVSLPGDLKATIDASTHDGHISLGIPVTVEGTFSTSQIHGKMNGGGQALTIQTGDGSIRLNPA
ncbi:MAG TPA: DUF4097 family beta strand repeat-containing protein [Terriglobales bacterium]|nr:DUF4097 family beta strand repeat-containing protein [Terriglobales bacterium]